MEEINETEIYEDKLPKWKVEEEEEDIIGENWKKNKKRMKEIVEGNRKDSEEQNWSCGKGPTTNPRTIRTIFFEPIYLINPILFDQQ